MLLEDEHLVYRLLFPVHARLWTVEPWCGRGSVSTVNVLQIISAGNVNPPNIMSFSDQDFKRKTSIFRQSLRFQETALNVFVQKVPMSYLKRVYSLDHVVPDDPLVIALRSLEETFQECRAKQVDVAASLDALLMESENRSGNGVVLLCWKLTFNSVERRLNSPFLVGIATVFDFVSTPNFSTDLDSMSRGDYNKLRPYFGNHAYIDAMCSKSPGVGRLLVLHAYNYSITRKKQGLVALAYSPRRNGVPESKRVFEALNFTTIIPDGLERDKYADAGSSRLA